MRLTGLKEAKHNPEKYSIIHGGEWEVYAYPYQNPESVFLRVRGETVRFEPQDLKRIFSRTSARIDRYDLKMKKGTCKVCKKRIFKKDGTKDKRRTICQECDNRTLNQIVYGKL